MQVGIVGKPNVGKSTFFNAATLGKAEVANYPFTTIDANKALAFIRVPEPAMEFRLEANPRNSKSYGGYRFVPVEAIDVAGLVPGAHQGRGLGNKFLDDLRQANVFIHVVDASGSTDTEGKPVKPGRHDPCEDIKFLEREIELWFFNIFKRNWDKTARKIQMQGRDFFKYFTETFSGLGIREKDVHRVINEVDVDPEKPAGWSDEGLLRFTKALRKNTMPMVIAANKVDIDNAEENIERMKKEFPELKIVPTSSMAELFLKNLSQEGIVEYIPGDSSFKVLRQEKLNSKYQKALEIIEETVFKLHSSTGVQEALNIAVLDVLDKIVVFPVEDETRLSDKKGNVLPDAILLGKGSTPRDLAYKIHTDIGRNFIAAINPRTKMKISSDKELEHLDIVKVIANA